MYCSLSSWNYLLNHLELFLRDNRWYAIFYWQKKYKKACNEYEGLSMINPIYEYEKTILEQHLDTFGHVNNAAYLVLYEEARWDFIT